MPAAFDFVEDTTAKSFDFQADPIPTPEPAPTLSPTAQLAKAKLSFAPLSGQALANLPDKPLITLPEWPKGEGSLEEQITGQVYGKLKDFLGFMTSPKGAAVTGAAIAAPEVAGPIISAAMLPAAVEEGIGTVKSIGKGDIPGAAGHLTGLTLTGVGVLGGVAQFLPRTVAEARVPAKLEKGPAPGTQRTRTGTVTIDRSDIPTPSRVPTKEAIPIQSETPFTPLTPQEESALKAQAEPEPLLQADVDRLFLDKLNEESNREIEAASAQPKPAPAPETPPAISAPEAKAPELTRPAKVEAPADKEPWQMTAYDYETSKTFRNLAKGPTGGISIDISDWPSSTQKALGDIPNAWVFSPEGTNKMFIEFPKGMPPQAASKAFFETIRREHSEEWTDHREIVERAIKEGKPVPPEVLADYPDLAPKPAAKHAAETGKEMGAPFTMSFEQFLNAPREGRLLEELRKLPRPPKTEAQLAAQAKYDAATESLEKAGLSWVLDRADPKQKAMVDAAMRKLPKAKQKIVAAYESALNEQD